MGSPVSPILHVVLFTIPELKIKNQQELVFQANNTTPVVVTSKSIVGDNISHKPSTPRNIVKNTSCTPDEAIL